MEDKSGLNSQAKLLEDTNLTPQEEEKVENQTHFSLVTLDSEPRSGPFKNSSRSAVLLPPLESLKMKTVEQEDSLMSNSHLTPRHLRV